MKNTILKVAIAACLALCAVRVIDFTYNHIPPFSEGECRAIFAIRHGSKVSSYPFLYVQIVENHALQGYSVVIINAMGQQQVMTASFSDLRETLGEKVNCL